MDPYYPCIKYKIPADPKLDGTDYFIVVESMNSRNWWWWWFMDNSMFDCFVSFSCENDQKAFYKIMKDR